MKNNHKTKNGGMPSFIIGILTVILVILISVIVFNLARGYRRKSYLNEVDMLRYLKNENYPEVTYTSMRNEYLDFKPNAEYNKLKAVGEYNYYDIVYRAYEKVGDNRAAEIKKKMDEQVALMGEYAYSTEEMDSYILELINKDI